LTKRAATAPEAGGGASERPTRAVAYVRMSTDHQKYSTENQFEVIQRYAESRGIEILRTYEDAGKSGLRMEGREALQRLIEVVESGKADFEAILVYDISRWGRFQDADEGAYHEHLCSRAGIPVHYCGEQFENDGSIGSNLLKTVKRVMAGEYSRELSVKVFAGQSRLIELGYRQGGQPGYGLRRMLVDQSGTRKNALSRGEQKSLQTDRVVLVRGPPEEVEVIRRIYHLFVNERKPEREIAALLNMEGVSTDLGRPWTRGTIHQVLINEKYIGNNVWNRVSFKLKKNRSTNTPDLWIRANDVFEALVQPSLFAKAQTIIEERSRRLSNEEMLEHLRHAFARHGYLSGLIIDESEGLPSSSAYQSRFGSLLRVYELVGFTPDRDYRYIEVNRTLRRMHPTIVADAIAEMERLGGRVLRDPATDLLTINGEFSASLVIARCLETKAGSLRWHIRFDTGLRPDLTVALRMDRLNRDPLDYYLLPRLDMSASRLRLAENNGVSLDAYRFDSLDYFFGMAARTCLQEVA
jgi:DNA invertase Pin-like site-specific DNA recombinase